MSAEQRRSRWTTSAAVTTVVIGLLASACGIPVSGQVETIAPEGHEELLDGTTSTTEPVPEPEDTDVIGLQLYFIGPDDLLERVERPFAEPAIIDDLLVALEQGPTTEEAALFDELGILESRIPDGLAASSGPKDDDLQIQQINVDPAGELRVRLQDDPAAARLIVSQLVCTVLGLPLEISGVQIFDGGEGPLQLSDNDAEPITGPATLDDFDGCRTGEDVRLELLEEGAETTTTVEG